MSGPLKNVYNEAFVDSLTSELKIYHKSVEKALFKKDIFDNSWADKELKDRMRRLAIIINGREMGNKRFRLTRV